MTHSVGLLWTSDRPFSEASTWQHTTLATDIHASGGIRDHNPRKRAAADPRHRPRGYRDRPVAVMARYSVTFKAVCLDAPSVLHEAEQCRAIDCTAGLISVYKTRSTSLTVVEGQAVKPLSYCVWRAFWNVEVGLGSV